MEDSDSVSNISVTSAIVDNLFLMNSFKYREGEMPKTPDKISIKMKFGTVTLEHVRSEQKKAPSLGNIQNS